MAKRRTVVAIVLVMAASAAGGARQKKPAPPVQQAAPVISIERKAGWMLRLEQQRVLTDPPTDRLTGASLIQLAQDADPGVRRRAMLALGRVGLAEAVAPLVSGLKDPDENVRAMAAFALGLLADPSAVAPLEAALVDASALVQGRAAEALGQIGTASAARAVAAAAAPCAARIAAIAPDEETFPQSAEVEACRLSILALVRLRQFDALASVVLGEKGQPVSSWWPVAFALQRSGDPKAADALASLVNVPGVYTRAFAIRGLAALKDARVAAPALTLVSDGTADIRLRITAVRALGQIGAGNAVTALLRLVTDRVTAPNLTLEAIAALGAIGDAKAFDAMIDLFSSPSPQVRAAALSAAARMDADGFLLALSGSDRDREWSVRASLADVLAAMPGDRTGPAIEELAADTDTRVQAPALRALARIGAADIDRRAFEALTSPDFALRSTAASIVGERQSPDGVARLEAAYTRGLTDATPSARLAVIEALSRYPAPAGAATFTRALADSEWPVRVRAAAILRQRGVANAAPSRPAPLRFEAPFFESDRLLRPAYSPQAYIETAAGVIQLELDVIDTPFTTLSFIELARAGFFNGLKVHRLIPNFVIQAGDPQGNGEGGPGYTIRDEHGLKPFVRGTVGMALGGAETGGSQFFVTLSPQPHLDGRYTVFGRVVRGMEFLDAVGLGDVIVRVTIQDGTEK